MALREVDVVDGYKIGLEKYDNHHDREVQVITHMMK